MKYLVLFLSVLFVLSSCSNERENTTRVNNTIPKVVDYNIHIKPILSDRCFACHGPDKNAMKAGLALYHEEGAYAELEESPGYYAIVPGKTDQSEVVKRITTTDQEKMMPPPESNLTLNDYERKLITKWIEQGAVYKPHWSLIPVQKPAVPKVEKEDWVSNPIDNFILSKLESIGLEPQEKASKEKLIRRASFDITGLPPTIEEIDDFLNDESETAYEKIVDRLLNSVAYAERMTSRWLDISRYADSHGYQIDFYRSMWPWREWVIKAYNENKPFDEFLTWQMAGDLLPDATYEQKLATGFNRNHSINQEGGIVKEEFRVEYVADRTNTLGATVLGLTLECARCHDHKYDPISQKEYYQLYGFFNSVDQKGGSRQAPGPSVKYPVEELDKLRDYLREITQNQTQKLKTRKEEILTDSKFISWVNNYEVNKENQKAFNPAPLDYFSFDNLDSTSTFGFADKKKQQTPKKLIEPKAGKYAGGLFIENGYNFDLGKQKYINEKQPFSISFWYYNKYYLSRNKIFSKVDEKSEKGIHIETDFRYINIQTQKSSKEAGSKLVSKEVIPDQQWVHIVLTYDGSGFTKGFSLFIDGEPMEFVGDKEQPLDFITKNASLVVGSNGLSGSGIDEIYLYDGELNDENVQTVYQFNPIDAVLQKTFTDLSEGNKSLVADHFLYHKDRKFKIALRNLESVKYKSLDIPKEDDLNVMTMAEMPEPNKTHILKRGAYDAPGEEVIPDTPESILSFSDSLPKNRFGLAQWLIDPKNPLTSRVAVNRYWQYMFGKGIVKTVEDFGNQGELPSHPELLDWLAATFMENGWDTKAMIKLMVMSSAYQQLSATSTQKRETDPENIYLARGSRYRMSGEMIRDQALAASGLLNNKVGGPGVRPYQPENLWSSVTAVGGGPLAKYVLDVTEDLYRRSVYTFWKRTVPPPSMLTFDAATRDRCIVSRQSTNTPLQALVLLNDPQYMEAARVMAQNILIANQAPEENISIAFRKLTGRKPKEKEINMLTKVYNESLNNFKENPTLIASLLNIGEYAIDESLNQPMLAAHTVTFSTILNLDETITKE
ncbi:DUF1553 domain-containing protein [Reichenbachiella sp. MALMAid0571]|uniref:DUF1553 domain-containing protein n=1 Tax=Reichenbachiella sp. MALMAid0571 TaxID=3143939 RepID=UPI0032DE6B16